MPMRRQLHCSFCRKQETEVAKLVAGPGVYICDQCVAIASRIMEGSSGDSGQPPQAEARLWRKLSARIRRLVWGGAARRVAAFVLTARAPSCRV